MLNLTIPNSPKSILTSQVHVVEVTYTELGVRSMDIITFTYCLGGG